MVDDISIKSSPEPRDLRSCEDLTGRGPFSIECSEVVRDMVYLPTYLSYECGTVIPCLVD
jgi:hypothetical protein